MNHTVKGFSIVSKAEVDDLWKSLAFPMIQLILAIWLWLLCLFLTQLVYLEVLGSCTAKSILKDFEQYHASIWNECSCTLFEHSLALPFFGIRIKTDFFQSYGHWWVFQIHWLTECNMLIALLFKILNNLVGISSLPLALFEVKLPRVLTSHPRISSSKRVISIVVIWFIKIFFV